MVALHRYRRVPHFWQSFDASRPSLAVGASEVHGASTLPLGSPMSATSECLHLLHFTNLFRPRDQIPLSGLNEDRFVEAMFSKFVGDATLVLRKK
mmetsp:Transcript_76231/g.246687  ORF Transcript_76231/g.246687 Transcript_76231/m.246687 type:complete len:95 (+) Transcript_76231:1443-1727(+)